MTMRFGTIAVRLSRTRNSSRRSVSRLGGGALPY
jgi:hypothetical protein